MLKKSISKKLFLAVTVGVLSNVFMSGVFAAPASEEALESYSFDEVVVTASRTENRKFEANANISVVTSKDIERMHYNNLEEVLRTMTNIQFLNYGMPGYNLNKVRINGSDSVLVLIDGVRATSIGTGQNYPFALLSDLSNVERIEVLKGSAAVLYGTDAKGGVINIITKKTAEAKTKLSISSGNFGTEEYKVNTEARVGDLTYRVFAQKSISGNYKDGSGEKWDSHQNAENFGVMLKQDFNDDANLVLNYTHSDEDFSMIDHIYNQDLRNGKAIQQNLQLTYTHAISDTLTNVLNYSNSRFEHYADINRPWGLSKFFNNRYSTETISDTLTKQFGKTHTVVLGAEKTKSVGLNTMFAKVDGNWTNVYPEMSNKAIFLQDEWKFDDKWKLTSAVRYDHPGDGLVEMESNTAKSFNLGYKFNEDTNVYAAYNDYFILPSFNQLYDTQYGNAKLLPEKGKNYEVGFNHMLDKKTMMNLHYFKRSSDQNIGFSSKDDTYVNDVEKAHGYDVQLEKEFDDNWKANFGYSRLSYSNTKATTGYGYLPKNSITLGVTYTKDKFDIGFNGKAFIGRDGEKVQSKAWPTDNYWVFNTAVNYKPTNNLKLFAKCNNIFDQHYAEHTDSINYGSWFAGPDRFYGMPGRNFIVGAEYSF